MINLFKCFFCWSFYFWAPLANPRRGRSKNAKRHVITNESITGFHFAAVKYDASSGKYGNSTYDKTMLRLYHEIPDDGPLPDPNASGSGSEENANHITWWPVMILQLHDDSVQVVREVTLGHVYAIICFYQVVTNPVWAWTMEIVETWFPVIRCPWQRVPAHQSVFAFEMLPV